MDLIFIVDLSSSMRYATDGSVELTGSPWNPDGQTKNNTTPQQNEVNGWFDRTVWPQTRLYALEESLVEMVETLKRNDADVRIAIADFGDLDHYEFNKAVADTDYRGWPFLDADGDRSPGSGANSDIPWEPANQLNFILGRDDEASKIEGSTSHFYSQPFLLHKYKYLTTDYYYTGKVDPMVYTGSGKVDADAFQDVDSIDLMGNGTMIDPGAGSLLENLNKQNGKLLGTNYDVGLETAYRLAKARQDANLAQGLDREVVCIFMSDGAAMQYNYFSGRSLTEAWSQYLIGETDEILENFRGATEIVTDANGNATQVDIGANSFFCDEPHKWPTRLYNLTGEMHQRLANGNLDKNASGAHFAKCSHTIQTAEPGQAFFQCLNGQMAGYWDTFFNVLFYNSDGDTDDIGIVDAVNGYLYPDLPINATGNSNNYKGAQFRKELISALRQPNYHTVQADTDVNGDGVVDQKDTTSVQYQYQTYSPYYYFYNTEGRSWWAEAIKGDSNKVYPVVNRFAYTTNAQGTKLYASGAKVPASWGNNWYNGEPGCQNNFVSTAGQGNTTKYMDENGQWQSLALEGKDGISGFKGLGLDIYTIGFSMASENRISVDEANAVLGQVCSGPSYQKNASSQAELTQVLSQIITSTASPATGAYFTDTMGDEFDRSTEKTVIHRDGEVISVNSQPTIRVMEYKLDGRDDRLGEPTVIETITIEGGKVAKRQWAPLRLLC